MIIKKVKLNNIRSYLEEEINFPNGSTLLAGNVGSGKSSILLAIDFALFGLQKGNITGSSLLRSDSNKGSVELEFELDDKKITVKRGLKKEGDKIVQDSGSLIVNDEKQSLTAVELKERILKLLNYPKELLTKSKSLIYRYTVYTPQEEMKEILNSDKEVRLDVLRKIFGIDKYKRIKENSEIFISNLKERRRESQGAISDLSDKENMKNKYNEDIKKIDNEIKSTKPKLDNVSKNIEDKKSKLRELENNIKKISEIKQEFRVNEIKLKNKEEIKNKNLKDVLLLKQNISDFKEEKTEIVDIHNELLNKEVLCKKIENDIRNLTIKTSEVKTNKRNSVILKENISKLSICPTCKQHVRNEYKSIINNDENGKIRKYELELLDLEQKMSSLDTDFINVRKDMDFFKNKEQEYNLYKMKLENFNEKNKKIELLNKELENIDEEILKLNKLNKDLTEKINEFKDIEIEYEIVKKTI
ncbi:SMC family ATPase [Candidatus Woesearchaeota archaeon]|nr:SMC family ATPase [Candidatus Woesearchaeota archaeon]